MSCDRYWRTGVDLVEAGEPDPHRQECPSCQQEHEARTEIVRALRRVGEGATGDPGWQVKVWERIASLETAGAQRGAPRRRGWARLATWLAAGWRRRLPFVLAPALAAGVAVLWLGRTEKVVSERVALWVTSGVVSRGDSSRRPVAVEGDEVRAKRGEVLWVRSSRAQEIRIYRRQDRVLACAVSSIATSVRESVERCYATPDAVYAALKLQDGHYYVLVYSASPAATAASMDDDLEAARKEGISIQVYGVHVR